jgi:hypothetical protein
MRSEPTALRKVETAVRMVPSHYSQSGHLLQL